MKTLKQMAMSKPRAPLSMKPKKICFTSYQGLAGGTTFEVGASQIEGGVSLVPLEVVAIVGNIRASSSIAGASECALWFEVQVKGSREQGLSAASLASISD